MQIWLESWVGDFRKEEWRKRGEDNTCLFSFDKVFQRIIDRNQVMHQRTIPVLVKQIQPVQKFPPVLLNP